MTTRPGATHAFSLRPMGSHRRIVGMDSRTRRSLSRLCSGDGRLRRRSRIRRGDWRRSRRRLVPARPARSLGAVLSRERTGLHDARGNVTNTSSPKSPFATFTPAAAWQVAYANQRVPGAVVAVRGEALVGGRPIGAIAVRVPPGASRTRRSPPCRARVAPARTAILGGRAPLSAAGAHLPPPAVQIDALLHPLLHESPL